MCQLKSHVTELGMRLNTSEKFNMLVYYHLDVEDEVTTVSNVDGKSVLIMRILGVVELN